MNSLLVTKSMGKVRVYVNRNWPQNGGLETELFVFMPVPAEAAPTPPE